MQKTYKKLITLSMGMIISFGLAGCSGSWFGEDAGTRPAHKSKNKSDNYYRRHHEGQPVETVPYSNAEGDPYEGSNVSGSVPPSTKAAPAARPHVNAPPPVTSPSHYAPGFEPDTPPVSQQKH